MKPIDHLVLLHGWGCDRRHWQLLLDALDGCPPITVLELPGFGDRTAESWPDDEALLQQLYAQLPRNCMLVGHSLGGMLAARLAAQPGQNKIAALLTIAANASFVQRDDWPGMAPPVFADFCASLTHAPEPTWEKFCGLQARGDSALHTLLKQLKSWRPQAIGNAWARALETLGQLDNRGVMAEIAVPALHLFGQRDALVPAAAAEKLAAQKLPVEVLDDCGHALQVSHPALVAEKIRELLSRADPAHGDSSPFAKRDVARSFGRAAASYDAAAHLQRAVCRQLLSGAGDSWAPKRIVDLGSGTGYGSDLLRRRFPQAEIIAVDLAEGMLRYARAERPVADAYIAADAESLPLADGSVDLVFSSLALQWCYRLPQLFGELQRVLAPGGRSLIATLGPGTLRELRQSWAQVDDGVHVNRFLPRTAWQDAAGGAGLDGSVREEMRVLHFDRVQELMRELKSVGAHNVNRAAGRGLTTRAVLRRLAEAYESTRSEAGLPASYEVFYLDLQRPEVGKAGRGAGVAGAGRFLDQG
ncbi:malonyl-ACP O-methyltransferase BioC [Microbulbifer hainanensis]|uniref:malonyl-ACP O-methyltransferase BioC n=1 Tax=Microbulbifer hainanensis TaxID=2735675 RepID=UPI001867305A|nr:malonyl-ACP O-methyltransferase BioC [Microbulbifer hainanensis]